MAKDRKWLTLRGFLKLKIKERRSMKEINFEIDLAKDYHNFNQFEVELNKGGI